MSTLDAILDKAELRIRDSGYNAFSFRHLAADLGIKSASVHYHFPTKGALGAAVAERYTDRFLAAVQSPSRRDVVAVYRKAFRQALERDGRVCLCGMLAAEVGSLPPDVAVAVRCFFDRCVDDLASRLGPPRARRRALRVMALLEGAMVLARLYGRPALFDDATTGLRASAID